MSGAMYRKPNALVLRCVGVDVVFWDTQLWMSHVCTGAEGSCEGLGAG